MSNFPWSFRTRTRSEIARNDDYRQQVLSQFIRVSTPLSFRMFIVSMAYNNLPVALTAVERVIAQDIQDTLQHFNTVTNYYLNCLGSRSYVLRGDEISNATRQLTLDAERAERKLQIIQNANGTRRKLTF